MGLIGLQPARARQTKEQPSPSHSAVKGSQTPTLIRSVIVRRTLALSEAPGRSAWVK
jgi:hypothetical protein